MENKYFTPSIEDLRIGYKFEVRLPGKDWLKETLTKQNMLYFSSFIRDINEGNFRVPYLTQAHLEERGWKYIDTSYFLVAKLIKNNYTLFFVKESYIISLVKNESNDIVYRGTCKDVNTFDYICKLLNIE